MVNISTEAQKAPGVKSTTVASDTTVPNSDPSLAFTARWTCSDVSRAQRCRDVRGAYGISVAVVGKVFGVLELKDAGMRKAVALCHRVVSNEGAPLAMGHYGLGLAHTSVFFPTLSDLMYGSLECGFTQAFSRLRRLLISWMISVSTGCYIFRRGRTYIGNS
jgi:hypothetical protein